MLGKNKRHQMTGIRLIATIVALLMAACTTAGEHKTEKPPDRPPVVKRSFNPTIDGIWIGNGISYSAYRDGESPLNGSLTSKQHILEDLRILGPRWNLIRLYGSGEQSRNILDVIRDNELPIRVMQGAWIGREQTQAENDAQVTGAIELANAFPDIIVAVNVGNEVFVDWSAHRIDDKDSIIAYIREVRARIRQPVTVSDDYNFWNKAQATRIADEIDFICLHAYAFWNNITLNDATSWTQTIYRDIRENIRTT
jgi:exo-beta-1,3-glucanase (GH17 family)